MLYYDLGYEIEPIIRKKMKILGGKRVYFDDSELKGKKTIITCPNCGEKTEYTYLKLGERE